MILTEGVYFQEVPLSHYFEWCKTPAALVSISADGPTGSITYYDGSWRSYYKFLIDMDAVGSPDYAKAKAYYSGWQRQGARNRKGNERRAKRRDPNKWLVRLLERTGAKVEKVGPNEYQANIVLKSFAEHIFVNFVGGTTVVRVGEGNDDSRQDTQAVDDTSRTSVDGR